MLTPEQGRAAEERLFPWLVAGHPAAEGFVCFCLGEHAALNARWRELGNTRSTREWVAEAELLIGRLIQHVFPEARLLRPLLDRRGSGIPPTAPIITR